MLLASTVTDIEGNAIAGVAVKFRIIQGGGTIGSIETIQFTNANGVATAQYHPSNQAEAGQVEVTVPDFPQIPGFIYTIHTVHHVIPGIVKVSGDGQTGTVHRCLAEPLKVKVVDRNHGNAPLLGGEVRFEVTAGNGLIVDDSPLSTRADVGGFAGINFIATTEGTTQIKASLWSNLDESVSFSAIGTLPTITAIKGTVQFPAVVQRMDTGEILIQGFLTSSGLQQSFGVKVVDSQGIPLKEVEVQFEKVSGPAGVLLPEKVITDSTGQALSGLVMDEPGEYNVSAFLPEFPEVPKIQNVFKGNCKNLEDIGDIREGSTFLKKAEEEIDSTRPHIALIKKGNGQIGANEKQLFTPFTVEARNRFGEVPKSQTAAGAIVKSLLNAYLQQAGIFPPITITNVVISGNYKCEFRLFEGDAGLMPVSSTTFSATQQASTTVTQQEPIISNNENQVTKNAILSLQDVNHDSKEAQANKDSKKTTQFQAQTVQAAGASLILVQLPGNSGEVSAGLTFGNNPINPVRVRAGFTGFTNVTIVYTSNNPDAVSIITQVQDSIIHGYFTFSAYFYVGPPEVRFVHQNEMGQFEEPEYLLPWTVLDPDGVLQGETNEPKHYWIEAKLPLNEPITTTCGVEIMDDCRKQITDIPGAIGSLGASGVFMNRISQTERYALYRTSPTTPFIFITQTLNLDEQPPTLPAGPVYVQSNGLITPFALADEKKKGEPKPDVRIVGNAVQGKGKKKFIYATLTSLNALSEIEIAREKAKTFYAEISGFKKESGIVLVIVPVKLLYKRGTSHSSIIIPSDIGFVYKQKRLVGFNYDICTIDGNEPTPRGYRIKDWSIDNNNNLKRGLLAISGVLQGDKIAIVATVETKQYFDVVVMIKGLTWNDLQRLGGNLTFIPNLQVLPDVIKQNIINTIKFALQPPKLTPNGDDITDVNQTDQQKQRIAIRKKIEGNKLFYTNFADKQFTEIGKTIATFKIPSAMAIEEFISKDDMHHLHWAFNTPDSALAEKIDMIDLDLKANAQRIAQANNYVSADLYNQRNAEPDEKFRKVMFIHYNQILNEFENRNNVLIDGFIKRQSNLGKPENISKVLPFAIYHTYERRGKTVGDTYVSPTAVAEGKNIYRADPVRNIITNLFSGSYSEIQKPFFSTNSFETNIPHLFIPPNAHVTGSERDWHSLPRSEPKFLFNIALSYQVDLNNGILTPALRQEFQNQNHSLMNEAYIIFQQENQWLIYSGGTALFLIRREEEKLKIYRANIYSLGKDVLFFVNRKGQVVICPDVSETDDATRTSLVEILQVADAVDEVEW